MALLKKGNRLTKKDVAKSCENGPLGFFCKNLLGGFQHKFSNALLSIDQTILLN